METTQLPDTTEVAIQGQTLPDVIMTAPAILMQNQGLKEQAKNLFSTIKSKIDTDGMSDLYDTELADFIERGRKAIGRMNERRKPVTQMLTLISKQFTGIEGEIQVDMDEAQKLRNAHATAKMEKIKADEVEKAKVQAKTNEAANLKAAIKTLYESKYIDLIADVKKLFTEWFNNLTFTEELNTSELLFRSAQIHIQGWRLHYPLLEDLKNAWKVVLPKGEYHTFEEILPIAVEVKEEILPRLEKQYETEMMLQAKDLEDKLPSRIMEVGDLANADAAETQRLLDEKKKREEAEAEALAAQAESKKTEAAGDAAVQAAGEKAAAMVDAAVVVEEAPKVAESYNIKIVNRAAWALIFQFWFEKEGKSLTDDKLEKFTLLRMKAFCEKYAKDNDEKIQSPVLSYEAVYKAK